MAFGGSPYGDLREVIVVHRWQVNDSRSKRQLLAPEIFLNGSNPPPTDLIDLSLWDHLVHLADHASITTTNHHGRLLKRLFDLDRGWVGAIGDSTDFISVAMVDVMDEFHASMFLLMHGFYRQAIATLRSILETTLLGAYFELTGDQSGFDSWRAGKEYGFGAMVDKMQAIPEIRSFESKINIVGNGDLFARRSNDHVGWCRDLYRRLCEFAHSRPGRTNADLWRSNGPIYVTRSIFLVAELYVETYSLAILLVKLARPVITWPRTIPRGYEGRRAKWAKLARTCWSIP